MVNLLSFLKSSSRITILYRSLPIQPIQSQYTTRFYSTLKNSTHHQTMKCPPTTRSSGISTLTKKFASSPTGSGVKKSPAQPKKPRDLSQAIKGANPHERSKWQAFFDSARDVSCTPETVQAHLLGALEEERSKKAEGNIPTDAIEYADFDVKGLMAQIYQDLYNVAVAQASRSASEEVEMERVVFGKVRDNDELLQEVSVGVEDVNRTLIRSASFIANPPTESARGDDVQDSNSPKSTGDGDLEAKMARCSTCENPAPERYRELALSHGGKFLSKLAHSTVFRETARNLDAPRWQIVSDSISENAISLMVFVESCGLEWWTELIRLNSLFPPSFDFTRYQPSKPRRYSPNRWVVTDKLRDVRRPTFEGKQQLHIPTNIYREAAFENNPRPPHWPLDRPYPEDPTVIRSATLKPCISCDSPDACTCSFTTDPLIWHPLVELRDYGQHRGTGVRALQRIPKDAILAEYVGEIFPWNYTSDPVYGFDFSVPGTANHAIIAMISAKRFGNWTRFINHSCDASTQFDIVAMGGRYRVVVQSVRDIEVFEEITIHYGFGYWTDKKCECGVEGCYEEVKKGCYEEVKKGR